MENQDRNLTPNRELQPESRNGWATAPDPFPSYLRRTADLRDAWRPSPGAPAPAK
jgi:hypothetical protein